MKKIIAFLLFIIFLSAHTFAQDTANLTIYWNKIIATSKTTATLQVVENPMVRPSSSIHAFTFKALKNLGADYVRYVPWFPYPRMAVAELKRPTKDHTFWDFTWLDSTMDALMKAQQGHSVVINFSTTPSWMWKLNYDTPYPENAYQVFWGYNDGSTLRDTTMKELADYYARLFSWYTKGGFTDELGKFHQSNHYYKIDYWEVLNEPDLEHNISPPLYTKIYDAIVTELKKISPSTKFIGMALAFQNNPEYFEYFLNAKHHKPGIPLDGISYHFYGTPSFNGQKIQDYQYTFFEKANYFLDRVRYIENIRKRLSPKTITMINEVGTIINAKGDDIPYNYWNLSGAMYAYLFIELTKLGIDVVGESQLVGYPSQFPDVSMMNWNNGKPNSRYWILKLIKDNFRTGDKLAGTVVNGADIISQGFTTKTGKKILLINTRNKEVKINLPLDLKDAMVFYVDVNTREEPISQMQLKANTITLQPFAVMVVNMK
ncbi:MAG TPA: hypothetical protein VMH01_14630 [Puia sp.]|nr:hypothetical protein [Puia sp.]